MKTATLAPHNDSTEKDTVADSSENHHLLREPGNYQTSKKWENGLLVQMLRGPKGPTFIASWFVVILWIAHFFKDMHP